MIWLLLIAMAHASHGQTSGTVPGNSQLSCRQIAVFGAVRNPSPLNAEPLRLLEVLARVGGPSERAGKVVRLVHSCECSRCSEAEMKADDIHEYNLTEVLRGLESENPYVVAGD